jgi:phosphoglycerate dehydrogenase-like enzyme
MDAYVPLGSGTESGSGSDLPRRFRLGLTADFFNAAGEPRYREMGERLAAAYPRIEFVRLTRHEPELQPEQLVGLHGIMVLTPRVTARSLERAADLLLLARFGVGYDSVDVAACTARQVAVTITAGAVDRPVAEATIAWLLALTHHVRMKDRLVREGRWDDRSRYMGIELRERTLGIVGFGGIGRRVIELLRGFDMRPPLVFDPFVSAEQVAAVGGRLVSLDELLREADFVSLHCPLNDATRGLIGSRELSRMKPTAFLINTARGGIVDEDALCAALAERRIAGAALDCFSVEPVAAPTRYDHFDNVLLAPHAIAWTEELFRDIGRMAIGGAVELLAHRRPHGLLNPTVLEHVDFQSRWLRVSSNEPARTHQPDRASGRF